MSKVYLISDGYFRDEYPMKTNLDIEKFYSVQAMYTTIQLRDLLGENIYDKVISYATGALDSGSMCYAEIAKVFEKARYLMVYYVAKGLEDFNKNDINDNRVQSLMSNIAFLEKRMRAYLTETDCLVTIQDTDTEPDRKDYNSLPTYFYK